MVNTAPKLQALNLEKSVGQYIFLSEPTFVYHADLPVFSKSRKKMYLNPLLHRYSFSFINNRQLLKTLWEKTKLLVTSNFSFSHNVFYLIRNVYPHLSIFLTSYLYLLLNWKIPKLTS